jgi:hypothetical protein
MRAYVSTAQPRPLDRELENALIAPWLGPDGQSAFYRQIAQGDQRHTDEIEPLYAQITAPTLVIWGEADQWIPRRAGPSSYGGSPARGWRSAQRRSPCSRGSPRRACPPALRTPRLEVQLGTSRSRPLRASCARAAPLTRAPLVTASGTRLRPAALARTRCTAGAGDPAVVAAGSDAASVGLVPRRREVIGVAPVACGEHHESVRLEGGSVFNVSVRRFLKQLACPRSARSSRPCASSSRPAPHAATSGWTPGRPSPCTVCRRTSS